MAGIFAFNGQSYKESFVAMATWTVTHNLNTTTPCVNVYLDSTDEQVIPMDISVTNANELVVTFSSSQTGRVIVA